MKRFEYLDHTADVIVKGYGDTLEEAFAATAEGMFAVITDLDQVEPREEQDVTADSIDRDGLLVGFLSKLIYVHEVDNFVLKDCDVTLEGGNRLTARIRGEQFDETRHEHGMHVKAVSYHMLEISEKKDGCFVQVLLDV